MRFGFLTPLHGWRAFIGEVGVVVLGVVIALAADNAVDEWQWSKQVKFAREGFVQEIGAATLAAYERQALQQCLQGRIRELADKLAHGGAEWSASPLALQSPSYVNVMPVVYRAPFRPVPTDSWDNALASGTLNHLGSERVSALSSVYKQITEVGALQQEEQRTSARLAPLAFDMTLDPRVRADVIGELAELDRLNTLMLVMSKQLVESVRQLDLDFPADDFEMARRELIREQRAIRGSCVEAPPIDLRRNTEAG